MESFIAVLKSVARWIGPLRRLYRRRALNFPSEHTLKIACVMEYRKRFDLTELVETGTCAGTMVAACQGFFSRIYSIELSRQFAEDAQINFHRHPHITIYQGDSAEVLPTVLKQLSKPALFWLDAHYSGAGTAKAALETPIIQELTLIPDHPIKDHVLLIDDARCFVGQNDYPTIDDLRDFILAHRPGWVFEVSDDIIRCHPRSAEASLRRLIVNDS